MVKPERRGRSVSIGAGLTALQKAGTVSAAAAASAAAADNGSNAEARATYLQYVKGKRQALGKMLKLHAKSPCAATCLLGARLHVLEAAEAAFKDGDHDGRESAVLRQLHKALELAACGAASHGSPTCLIIASVILHVTGGRPGSDDRQHILGQMAAAFGPEQLSAELLSGREWMSAAHDIEGVDRWPMDLEPGGKQDVFVTEACRVFVNELKLYRGLEVFREILSRGTRIEGYDHMELVNLPADSRLTQTRLLPELKHWELKKRQDERGAREHTGAAPAMAQRAEQERRQQEQRRRREEEEQERLARQAELEGRRIPELRARAAKVHDYLRSCAAAAAAAAASAKAQQDEGIGTAGAGAADTAPGAARPSCHLTALLQQTELEERELRELLADKRELVGAAEQQAVLDGLERARAGQAMCYQPPPQLAALLGTAPDKAQQLAAGGSAAAEQAGCLVARLRELLRGSTHELTPAQEATIQERAPGLGSISAFALAVPRRDPYEQQDDLALPSPDSVLPECPGDLEALLGQEGAWRGAGAAPRGALLAVGSGLRPDGASRGQGPAGLAELDLIDGLDDELEQHVLHQPSGPVGSASPPAPQEQQWEQDPCAGLDRGYSNASRAANVLDCLTCADGGCLAQRLRAEHAGQEREHLAACWRRDFLAGLQLLDMLELRVQLASAAGAPGQPDPAVLAQLAAGLERLAAFAAQGRPMQAAQLVKIFVEDPEDHAEELTALASVSDLDPVAAGASILQQRAWRGVHDIVQTALSAGLDAADAALPYLAEVRKSSCRSIVAALRMLQQDRRMGATMAARVHRFLQEAVPVVSGDDDPDEAGASEERGSPTALDSLGQLPLMQLLQLRAFLALHASSVYLPSGLDVVPEVQGSLVPVPAEVTQTGGICLTPAGLMVVVEESRVLEAAGRDPRAEVGRLPLPAERLHLLASTGGAAGAADDADVAAGMLAKYSLGLPVLEAAVARKKPSAALAKGMQDAHSVQLAALRLQRLAHIHGVLGGLVSLAGMVEQVARALRALVEDAEDKLRVGCSGGAAACEEALNAVLAVSKKLPYAMDRLGSAARDIYTAQSSLLAAPVRFEAQLLQRQEQGINGQLELLAGGAGSNSGSQRELLRRVTARRKLVEGKLKLMDRSAERMLQGLQEVEPDKLATVRATIAKGSRSLAKDASSLQEQSGDMQSALVTLKGIVNRHLGVVLDCRPLVLEVADAAAEQAEACIGQLVYAHSMQPSLEPAFRALTRHLLGAKWEAELQAQQVAEEEARRQAALQALLQEEEEQGGSAAAAQAKQEQKRAKKRAKKAAKKEGAAASKQAEPQQQAGPKHAERMQDSMQQEREAGLQRLLQQMEQEQEEQLREQREQRQQQQEQEREQEEQQRQQREQQQWRQREQEEQERQQRMEQQRQREQQQQKELQKLHKQRQRQEQEQESTQPSNQQKKQLQERRQPAAVACEQAELSQQAGRQACLSAAGSAKQDAATPTATQLPVQCKQRQPTMPAATMPEEDLKQAGPASTETAAATAAKSGAEPTGAAVAASAAADAAGKAKQPSAHAVEPRQEQQRWREQQGEQQTGAAASPSVPAQHAMEVGGRQQTSGGNLGKAGSSGTGRSISVQPATARPVDAPPRGGVPQPTPAQPGIGDVAPARPAQRFKGRMPALHAVQAAAVQPAPANGNASQKGLPPATAAGGEPCSSSSAPKWQADSGTRTGRSWQQHKAGDHLEPVPPPTPAPVAAAPAPAAGSADPAGDDGDLTSLLGMMGLESEEQGAPAVAAAAAAAPSPEARPVCAAATGLRQPRHLNTWAQRAGGIVSGEAAAAGAKTAATAPTIWPAPGQSQEDAELEAAIQASLAEAAAAAGPVLQPRSRSPTAVEAAEAPSESGLGLAGLRNDAGEYNCFLNVIVQCLWRCTAFRRQVAGWDPAFCSSDPVVQCLHNLFQQFQRQERQLCDGSSGACEAGPSPSGLLPVDPTPLREALAALPGQQFRVGEMNDAAEVLLAIYERVIEAAAGLGRSASIEPTFGLSVREEVHCPRCGKATHQSEYTQYFYNTQATVLHMLSDACGSNLSTGQLLREAELQHQKSCDEDVGGCGRPCPVNHLLQHAPRVFTLQLAWESQSEQPADIAGTLAAIDEEVDLGEVYQGTEQGAHRYRLRSMVCYYGQHYQALVLVPEAGGWLVFDDTHVARVGGWEAVQRKCEAGRIQASVLFYEAA